MTSGPVLRTARLEIAPLSAAALDALVAGDRERLTACTGAHFPVPDTPPPLLAGALPSVRDRVRTAPDDAPWWTWLAVERGSRAAVGVIGFGGPPGPDGVVTVGYSIYPLYQGRGFATEALSALSAWAIEEPRVRAVRATIPPGHMASRRTAERAGLRHVGVNVDAEVGDVMVYELRRPGSAAPGSAAAYAEELAEITHTADALLQSLDDASLNRSPADGGWSVGECLDHLLRSGRLYLRPLQAAIARGTARGIRGTPPFGRGVVGDWFVRLMEPPARRHFRAPRKLRPTRHHTVGALRADFAMLQADLAATAHAADGLDLGRLAIWSPAVPLLRLNLAAAFAAIAAHERRHLDQARAVMASGDVRRET